MTQQVRFSELVNPTPRQKEFLDAIRKFKFTLYGGAAGGGKSYILRWALVLFIIHCWVRYRVRVSVGLFCEDYPALRDRHIDKIKTEFPSWLGRLKDDGRVYELSAQFGGGTLLLRNLDDPSKYDSVEFAAVAVDEIGKNKEAVFHELRKRLRWPRVPGQPSLPEDFVLPFLAATNPGAAWVKRLWIDRDFPEHLASIADQFCYVPAKASDNPYNPPDYYSALKTLPPLMAKAYADGSWDLFQGQYYEEFRKDIHVVHPFLIPDYWVRFCAADWGYNDEFCNLWFAVSPVGEVYVYREVYDNKITADKWAKILLEKTGAEKLSYKKLDPSAWSARADGKRTTPGPSIAEEFQFHGWDVSPADNSRVLGWTRIHQYLAWEADGAGLLIRKPKLYIFNTCVNLIRTLPALVKDEFNHEDVQREGLEDHAPDALRYGLMTRPPLAIQPLETMSAEERDAVRLLRSRMGEDPNHDWNRTAQ